MRIITVFSLAAMSVLLMTSTLVAQPGPPGAFGPDPFQEAIDALGDLNLQPDFALSKEQKEKVQALREDVRKAEQKWLSDHAEDFKKLGNDTQAAFQEQDPDKIGQVMTRRMELFQSAPKTDQASKQLRAILTDDQAKALEKRIEQRREEMMARLRRMMGFGMGPEPGDGPP